MTRYSKAGARCASLALLIGSALAALPPAPAEAAASARPRDGARVATVGPKAAGAAAKVADAAKGPASAASVGKGMLDDASTCGRARRRLWVDGEGWVVRRVTMCP